MATRILIADDHSAIRAGIQRICSNKLLAPQFGEAENSQEVFRRLKEQPWDLLILDIDLPGMSGLEILKQVKKDKIRVPVLMFSFHSEHQIALKALKIGAAGYLSKDAADKELITAIEHVLHGRKYVSAAISEKLFSILDSDPDKEPYELLSEREYQIFLLIASGKDLSQMADLLFLSRSTISTYRARILEKMGLRNNAELAAYAASHKLV